MFVCVLFGCEVCQSNYAIKCIATSHTSLLSSFPLDNGHASSLAADSFHPSSI